jgi:hypothetical protein
MGWVEFTSVAVFGGSVTIATARNLTNPHPLSKEAEARKLLKKRLGEIALGRFAGPKAERILFSEIAQDFLTDYTDSWSQESISSSRKS